MFKNAFASFAMAQSGLARLTLLDLAGDVIQHWNPGVLAMGEQWLPLDLSKFAAGVYFVSLETNGGEGWHQEGTFKLALTK